MLYTPRDFVKVHKEKYINYCEVLILPDGTVTYAEPSHIYKLEMLWGVPFEELFDGGPHREQLMLTMPRLASPIHWLCEDLNVVSLWYDTCIFPRNYTIEQLNTVKLLMATGCVFIDLRVDMAFEKSIEQYRTNIAILEQIGHEREVCCYNLLQQLQQGF